MTPLAVDGLQHSVSPHFWSTPRDILRDVTFSVERGEVFGFLGPNGAGKTTTIKVILGLLRPDQGSVRLFNGTIRDPRIRRRIGFLPERSYFPDHLTGFEVVLQHGILAGLTLADAKRRAEELLARLALSNARDRLLGGYSKGMLQRVGMAQALVAEPELLILDEPMSGLDPMGRHAIRELFGQLREQGVTVFFSTHILSDVETLCDRVAILIAGEIRQNGRLSELLDTAVEHVEIEVDAVPNHALSELTVVPGNATDTTVTLRAPSLAAANHGIDTLRAERIQIRRVETVRRSLEDLFIQAATAPSPTGQSR